MTRWAWLYTSRRCPWTCPSNSLAYRLSGSRRCLNYSRNIQKHDNRKLQENYDKSGYLETWAALQLKTHISPVWDVDIHQALVATGAPGNFWKRRMRSEKATILYKLFFLHLLSEMFSLYKTERTVRKQKSGPNISQNQVDLDPAILKILKWWRNWHTRCENSLFFTNTIL